MENSADTGGCCTPRPKAEVDNTLPSCILKFRHFALCSK